MIPDSKPPLRMDIQECISRSLRHCRGLYILNKDTHRLRAEEDYHRGS